MFDNNQIFVHTVILQSTDTTSFNLGGIFPGYSEIAIRSKPMFFNDCYASCKELLSYFVRYANLNSKDVTGLSLGVEVNPKLSGVESVSGAWDDDEAVRWWIYNEAKTGTSVKTVAKATIRATGLYDRILN